MPAAAGVIQPGGGPHARAPAPDSWGAPSWLWNVAGEEVNDGILAAPFLVRESDAVSFNKPMRLNAGLGVVKVDPIALDALDKPPCGCFSLESKQGSPAGSSSN